MLILKSIYDREVEKLRTEIDNLKFSEKHLRGLAVGNARHVEELRAELAGAWVRNAKGQLQRHPLNTGNKETAA